MIWKYAHNVRKWRKPLYLKNKYYSLIKKKKYINLTLRIIFLIWIVTLTILIKYNNQINKFTLIMTDILRHYYEFITNLILLYNELLSDKINN